MVIAKILALCAPVLYERKQLDNGKPLPNLKNIWLRECPTFGWVIGIAILHIMKGQNRGIDSILRFFYARMKVIVGFSFFGI
jgi:hypothetical protein